jgi:uncharacterized protein YutE (UPF0331/DUF86 family)
LVDADRVEARIQKLEELIEQLDEVRRAGEDAYLANARQRAATERWLQVAVQICIDLGTQLVTEQSARPPSDYAEVFKILGEKGVIPNDLARRLGDAAKQRNLIVHPIWRSTTAPSSPRWPISTTYASSRPASNDRPVRNLRSRFPSGHSNGLHSTGRFAIWPR